MVSIELGGEDIFVTQPSMPSLEEFQPYLEAIWKRKILTNGGPFHQQFEDALCKYLQIENIALFTNGTLALVTALQALGIQGEVITTPYSFVATSHALLWNGIGPVFVDIDPGTLNLDPAKIEEAITPRTTAILPVHCYGRPCDVDRIQEIADRYKLKVVYDAAHAFGVRPLSGSLCASGDLAMLSFHATKAFNTFEGGAIVCPDLKTKQHIDHLKNFGFVDEVTVVAPGINGKMSELNAAFGLLQLKYIDEAIERRAAIASRYIQELSPVRGIRLHLEGLGYRPNHSYFPIFIDDDYMLSRDELYVQLKTKGIFARRYFYPLITEFPMYRLLPSAAPSNLPVATDVSRRILCLPIYPALKPVDQDRVIKCIRGAG